MYPYVPQPMIAMGGIRLTQYATPLGVKQR